MTGILYLTSNIVQNKAETFLEMCLNFLPRLMCLTDLIKHIFICNCKKVQLPKCVKCGITDGATRHRDPAILNTSASQILFTNLEAIEGRQVDCDVVTHRHEHD
jgi:hypothetical protein